MSFLTPAPANSFHTILKSLNCLFSQHFKVHSPFPLSFLQAHFAVHLHPELLQTITCAPYSEGAHECRNQDMGNICYTSCENIADGKEPKGDISQLHPTSPKWKNWLLSHRRGTQGGKKKKKNFKVISKKLWVVPSPSLPLCSQSQRFGTLGWEGDTAGSCPHCHRVFPSLPSIQFLHGIPKQLWAAVALRKHFRVSCEKIF